MLLTCSPTLMTSFQGLPISDAFCQLTYTLVYLGCRDSKTQVPDHDVVASVVFSSPNLASVGLTEEAAIKELKDFEVFSSSFT